MQSLDAFWFPMMIWTLVALIIFVGFRAFKRLNPLYHYHLRAATIAAIPIGLITTYAVHFLTSVLAGSGSFDPALFIMETPETFYLSGSAAAAEFNPNWWEPNFLLGAATALILFISGIMLIRMGMSYLNLKKLHASLSKQNLNDLQAFNRPDLDHVKLSFHEHPLVPFTFGWRNPIIVLPKSIQDDPEKVRMAIQHELVHIKRGDYLLQLFLSVIESLFWFHPLIRFGAREIETYREISCDQEVLNTSGISLKKYASMLYELLPLNRGLGSFSVSMAVQHSTLKKRITTMKYHKMYKTSIKRSLFFLLVMILGVTLPIACSDLRGPEGLSPEELENADFVFNEFSIEVNGKNIIDFSGEKGVEIGFKGLSIGVFNMNEYGVFAISMSQFEGSRMAGDLSDNQINFSIDELDVTITSKQQISKDFEEGKVWVRHYKNVNTSLGFGQFPDIDALENRISTEQLTNPVEGDDGDYFVVVEEMPKLIGGLASVQSKVQYPELAKRAGIEGRVVVQFIINENGDVENPRIIRGIGGGCDEAALAAVSEAKFEPGIQHGQPVRVQFSLPIVFRLNNSDFTSSEN